MKIFAILLTDAFFARQVSGKSGCGAVRSSYLSGVDITPISVVCKRERNYIPDPDGRGGFGVCSETPIFTGRF